MRHDKLAVVAVILTASGATAVGEPPATTPPATTPPATTPPATTDESAAECPEALRGAELELKKLEGGVSVELTTSKKDQVPALQRLVRELAILIEHHSKLVALHPELVEDTSEMTTIPAVDIDVRDIDIGAKIVVRPENPGEIGLVRAQADELKEFWDENKCIQEKAPQRVVEQLNI